MAEHLARVEVLRRAVAAAVAAGSLRGVARAVGISAPSLQDFVDGAEPRRATTRRALENWYVKERARAPAGNDVDAAEAALRILVRGFPAEVQRGVALGILDSLAEQYRRERGEEDTGWIAAVHQRVASGWGPPGG